MSGGGGAITPSPSPTKNTLLYNIYDNINTTAYSSWGIEYRIYNNNVYIMGPMCFVYSC